MQASGDCLKTKKAGGGLGGRAQRPPRSQAKVLASLVVFGFVVAAAAADVVEVSSSTRRQI